MGASSINGLPPGFELEDNDHGLPPGFVLDTERPKEQFDLKKPFYNIPGVLKEELMRGHAPNAIEPTTSAEVMMPMVMGSPGMISMPQGAVTSATMGENGVTAGLLAAANREKLKEGLIGTAKKGWDELKPMIKWGLAYKAARGLLPHN